MYQYHKIKNHKDDKWQLNRMAIRQKIVDKQDSDAS